MVVKRKHASSREVIAIGKVLERELQQQPNSKDWEYKNDYDDEKVAAEVGCNPSSVARIRLENYGTVRGPRNDRVTVLMERIAALEKRLDDAEASGRYIKRCNDELTFKHNRLCATLTTDYRINAKHFEYQLPDAPGALPLGNGQKPQGAQAR